MKNFLVLSFFTALFLMVSMPYSSAASSAARSASTAAQVQDGQAATSSNFIKKEKRQGGLKKWWAKQTAKFQKLKKWVERISLGFVGFIVMLVGGLFIVLGLVIPYLGILFLVLGIIIAFVGLLLWLILSRIGVRVSSDGNRRRNYN